MFRGRPNLGIRNAGNSRDETSCERVSRQARNRPPGAAQRITQFVREFLGYPRGHVEPIETLDDALARELAEELGIVAGTYSVVAQIPDPSTAHVTYHLYVVSD